MRPQQKKQSAAFRGIKVIVPVDGMYTVYHITNAPGVGQHVTLTKIDLIK